MNIAVIIGFSILFLNLLCIIAIIFVERKNPVSAVAWLLTFSFLPGIGFLLYILFGKKPRFYKYRKFREKDIYDKQYGEQLMQQINLLSAGIIPATNPAATISSPLMKYSTIGAESFYTEGNAVEIFTDAQIKYDRLLEDIKNAHDHIHMVYFIYRDDEVGRAIVDALTDKVKEGISVRLIIDDAGSITTSTKRLFNEFITAGGSFSRFSPVLSLSRLNFRNHRKIVIIDGKIGYTGGMNVGDEYIRGKKKITRWRDTHLRMTGPAVYMLQIRFLMDWHYAIRRDKKLEGRIPEDLFPQELSETGDNIGINIVSSGPDRSAEYIKSAYICMCYDAKEKIYIQTPYFIPDQPFIECLTTMANSGIEINLMIPGMWDKWLVYQATYSYLEDLIDYPNVKIYVYDGFLHSKVVAVDDNLLSIGTCNIDIRSFALHFEINAFMYDYKLARSHIEIFEQDAKLCKLLTPEEYHSRPTRKKIVESIARLFTPLF